MSGDGAGSAPAARRWAPRTCWVAPPPTPCCLARRELGLGREPYRSACLAVRSACAATGRRQLRRHLARTDAADSEYNVDRVYLHRPAEKRVLVAPAFGPLDQPGSFQPFFTELSRKDDRCTALVERPHPYHACRPQAFSVLVRPDGTDLEVVDVVSRRVERRVTLTSATQMGAGSGRPAGHPAFKYIHHDLERNELVITSVQTVEALVSVIIFSIQPVQFLVRFQVLRKEFPHADSATVGEGVVMLTSRSRGVVYLYSIDKILEERSPAAGLGDHVIADGRPLVVGGTGDGVPTNGQLTGDAAPVAVFAAHQGYLELGGSPHHLVSRRKAADGFEVTRLSDGARVLTCGPLRPGLSSEAATFVDDGPYLVQHSTAELRVFDLTCGHEVLRVDAGRLSVPEPPVERGPVTTRSGRRVRMRRSAPLVLLASDWWLAWDIEDELELLVVVVVEEVIGDAAVLQRLLLYDRRTWTLSSDTPLHYSMPLNGAGLSQVAVVVDRCLLFVKLRSSAARCVTLVYSLVAHAEPREPRRELAGVRC
ncbi:uncharacterized protein LOC122392299 [Amphibalanus amphitrite]|uniref:uncharacterized protein LOC122392299 n=1 Tax=Amphibalanus amphitrite TaxID=1232801 RepID=UPI001C92365E|nr:uncharacterized protein LOC122392299 [Amphibalanus amphitrite]XP_043242940.1 uncharacterized protein LOC122392299 [Amphibalanus amphitrite]XP_043242950.1 uncharacterized protein LOC122392299 [Amphibalanus amphitrite]